MENSIFEEYTKYAESHHLYIKEKMITDSISTVEHDIKVTKDLNCKMQINFTNDNEVANIAIFFKIKENDRLKALEIVNDLNIKYDWPKFVAQAPNYIIMMMTTTIHKDFDEFLDCLKTMMTIVNEEIKRLNDIE